MTAPMIGTTSQAEIKIGGGAKMRGFIKKAIGRTANPERGFTLIELLVVIGIIVALASITAPQVTKFAGQGDVGALEAETETVQSAMSAMMADKGITTVAANDEGTTSNGQNTWTPLPAGTGAATLDGYLTKNSTKFFYCWDSKGIVYAQNKMDGLKAVPADAKAAASCATPA